MAESELFDRLDGLNADELRQRLRSLRALIARAPVPIAIAHDPECRHVSGNGALAALLGLPSDANFSVTPEPGERPLYRIQRNGRDLPREDLPMQYAIAHRVCVSNELELVRPDGTVIFIQNDVEPLFDTHGVVYGCVSVCVDVTARKVAELRLREADRRKDEFLATLSHELRNPLAPIRTALEVMRIARTDPTTVEQARLTMERQLVQLVRITDDLLDVARITQNKVELRRERLDLRVVLQSALEATRSLIDAQNITLTVDLPASPLRVEADFTRMAQVFCNLLNNAAKYTPRQGAIRVAATEAAGSISVTVEDTGVGIEPAMLTRIFDMFAQLEEHRDRAQGGLGIGLTLAKRLVALHGGTIEARSQGVGSGSSFVVRLPSAASLAAPAPVAETGKAVPSAPRASCRVLIAEDNPDAAEMMRVMLALNGHDVRVANDGVTAIDLARSFDPQIVFLDIGMPRMDGYEAARHIRNSLGTRVTLVALTGWGQDEDKRRAREAGFDHHLTKPPEPEVLEALIAGCAPSNTPDRP